MHFVILGMLCAWLMPEADSSADPLGIQITGAQIERVRDAYEAQLKRPLQEAARDKLLAEMAEEEALYREGLRLGLAEDDFIVRRRIVQKMRFLLRERPIAEPSEAELLNYYRQHTEEFSSSSTASFRQLLFRPSPQQDGNRRAQMALGRLQNAACTASLDDMGAVAGSFQFQNVTPADVRGEFGQSEIARAIHEIGPNVWQGPFESPYGWHLVCVSSREAGKVRPFAEVRSRVAQHYGTAKAEARYRENLARVIARYTVTVAP